MHLHLWLSSLAGNAGVWEILQKEYEVKHVQYHLKTHPLTSPPFPSTEIPYSPVTPFPLLQVQQSFNWYCHCYDHYCTTNTTTIQHRFQQKRCCKSSCRNLGNCFHFIYFFMLRTKYFQSLYLRFGEVVVCWHSLWLWLKGQSNDDGLHSKEKAFASNCRPNSSGQAPSPVDHISPE